MQNLLQIIARQEQLFPEFLSKQHNLLLAGYLSQELINWLKSIVPQQQLLIHSWYFEQLDNSNSGANWFADSKQLDNLTIPQLTEQQLANTKLFIYLLPKTKSQAIVDFALLTSKLPQDCTIWVVGDNNSGIKGIDKLFSWLSWGQLDNARRARIYQTFNKQQLDSEQLAKLITSNSNHYNYDTAQVKLLPGVFSAKQLDQGSQLLIESLIELNQMLTPDTKVIDYGSGSGVLSLALLKIQPLLKELTLVDHYLPAIISSQINLCPFKSKDLTINYCFADSLVQLSQSYDLIITNPPFHMDLEQSFTVVEQLLNDAANKLTAQGALLLVANAHLPYQDKIVQYFKSSKVVKQNNKFKVYLATSPRN